MLILALLGAFIFYVGLYLLWEHVPLDSLEAILRAIDRMFWMPTNTLFTIYRGILLIILAYVVLELFISNVPGEISVANAVRPRVVRQKSESVAEPVLNRSKQAIVSRIGAVVGGYHARIVLSFGRIRPVENPSLIRVSGCRTGSITAITRNVDTRIEINR